jgi:hypothetical protein
MSGLLNNSLFLSTAAAAGGYQVERSLRFNSSDSAYLSRTPAVAGNRTTWTWAAWVKRSNLGGSMALFSGSTSTVGLIGFQSNDTLFLNFDYGVNDLVTTQVFRDSSAWYHVLCVVDTNNSTASDRLRLYVNSNRITAFSTAIYPSLGALGTINIAQAHNIGRRSDDGSFLFDGYLADVFFIDGQALTPSSFTEVSATTGQLIPIEYTGTFGTNGFQLKFADNSAATAATLGADTSGNGNNWTPNNLSVTAGAGNDSLVDTPTSYGTPDTGVGGEVRGNYATLNPLNKSSDLTSSNGNLDYSSGVSGHRLGFAGIRMDSGKWYWEQTMNASFSNAIPVGVAQATNTTFNTYVGAFTSSIGLHSNGDKYYNGTYGSYGMPFGSGDVIGVAFDADNGTVTFYKNGVSGGTALTGLTGGGYFPAVGANNSGDSASLNFGQRAFAYPLSGFKALCDTNLGAPLVAKPNTLMDVIAYSGSGASRTFTDLTYSPDLVWIKQRSGANNHRLYDVVRGATKALYSNLTNSEGTDPSGLTAFTSNGFTLGDGDAVWNASGQTYAAWCWDAGTSTVSNTAGSITSQVRANVSAGFSVVSYTGTGAVATVGHGLGVAPQLIIARPRNAVSNWVVYHASEGAGKFLRLNTTDSSTTDSTAWNNTTPTSTVYSVGNNAANGSGLSVIAYCFAPVVGYSSFGSYVGNYSADGPFVYTGFRSRFVMIKCSSTGGFDWRIFDTSRSDANGANVVNYKLYPNSSAQENDSSLDNANSNNIDILSNGFKLRTANGATNDPQTYIYAAFAENPFQYARAR